MTIDIEKLNGLLAAQKNSANKLTRVPDEKLHSDFNALVEKNQPHLRGEYDPYTIYQHQEGHVYSLIYASYKEDDGVNLDDAKDLALEDGKFMHQKLKESGLPIDYLFIVIYYDYSDIKKGSICINGDAVITQGF